LKDILWARLQSDYKKFFLIASAAYCRTLLARTVQVAGSTRAESVMLP
jgi:hypothetical protein